jgi:hypothetical protein
MVALSDAMKHASSTLLVLITLETTSLFFWNWKLVTNSLSITLNMPHVMVVGLLFTIHSLQLCQCVAFCIQLNTRRQLQMSFGAMSLLQFLELGVRIGSDDAAESFKCACLLAASTLRLLDVLSSAEQRVYSGFVGSTSSDNALADVVVARLRHGLTRYRASSLMQITCAAVVVHTAATSESVLTGTELRRQLGRAAWKRSMSLLAMLCSLAIFDRSKGGFKKHL